MITLGSLIVATIADEKIVFASDTRGFIPAIGAYVDDRRKIAILEKNCIVGVVGLSETPQISFIDMWSDIFHSEPDIPVYRSITNNKAFLAEAVRRGTAGQTMPGHLDGWTTVIFAWAQSGEFNFRTVGISEDYKVTEKDLLDPSIRKNTQCIGYQVIVKEFTERRTEWARRETLRWRSEIRTPEWVAMGLVQMTIDRISPEDRVHVGGRVVALQLHRDGTTEWIRKLN